MNEPVETDICATCGKREDGKYFFVYPQHYEAHQEVGDGNHPFKPVLLTPINNGEPSEFMGEYRAGS